MWWDGQCGDFLTDQYQDQYVDTRNLLSVYHHTGREFLAGVRFGL